MGVGVFGSELCIVWVWVEVYYTCFVQFVLMYVCRRCL